MDLRPLVFASTRTVAAAYAMFYGLNFEAAAISAPRQAAAWSSDADVEPREPISPLGGNLS